MLKRRQILNVRLGPNCVEKPEIQRKLNFSQNWIDTETRFDSNLWANVGFSAMSPGISYIPSYQKNENSSERLKYYYW